MEVIEGHKLQAVALDRGPQVLDDPSKVGFWAA